MRILFLSRWLPFPADNGSKIRVWNILRSLGREHDVALVAFGSRAEIDNAGVAPAGQAVCSRLRVIEYREFCRSSLKATLGLLSPRPRSIVDTHNSTMVNAIRDECRAFRPDLIIASQLAMVPYVLDLPGVPAIFEELELAAFKNAIAGPASRRGRWRAQLTWWKLGAYVRRVLPRFAACTVVSEPERALLREVAPDYSRVAIIPNAVDLASYEGSFGPPRPNTLIFSGALTYAANSDALAYFLGEVYPLIRAAVPDVRLRVTGDHAGIDLGALARQPGVELTGYLPDVRPAIAQSWVSVVPLRLGGGTRLKILEAMALRTPVVATVKGAEGLDVTDRENILLADSPADFASGVVSLLHSPGLRQHLATGGRRLVVDKYDWQAVGKNFRTLISRALPSLAPVNGE